jgi:uncharacterized caspase-like protein
MTLLILIMVGIGCGQKLVFPRLEFKSEEPASPSIPLTVRIEIPDALKQAQLFYRDSCNVPQSFPLGERLAEQIKADAGQVFEKTFEGSQKDPADAVLTAAVENSEVSLNIPRREIGEYPLKVLVRVRVTVTDGEGKVLFNDALKGEGKWTVSTDGTECRVQGVMLPFTEAMEKLSDRTVENLSQSVKIRDMAIRLRARQELLAGGKVPGGGVPAAPVAPAPPGRPDGPTLSFRASLEDENRNQVLEGGEKVVVRVEVSNSGPGIARGVAVVLSGTTALVTEFTNPTLLGDLQPGEKKQVAISSTLSSSLADQQAELVVQVTEAGGFGVPTRKRFVASVRPGGSPGDVGETVEVLSVDVDQIPARAQGFERRTSYAVVVGLGAYREDEVPRLKYAKRDAEVVAKHLTAIAGFAPENVRVLTDERALLADLQETFEDWLPRKASATGIVLVYLVGNGIINQAGGEPVLLPFEGRLDSPKRGYSLRRLQEVLSRLPSRLNLVFADLSFSPVKGDSGPGSKMLFWGDRKLTGKGRTVIVGSSSVGGSSQVWEQGQHGLFTYHFLKGIRGHGDFNQNGWVDVGELLSFVRAQVSKGATELKREQTPVVVPDVDPDGPIGTFPFSKASRVK